MKTFCITTLLLILLFATANAIELPQVIENKIYSENIKTVIAYSSDEQLSKPVIMLNSGEQITFSFDDLDNDTKYYYYTIYHCDRNWELSEITQQEYFESFTEFPLSDYTFSRNTKVDYVNYQLKLPNENVPIKLSGNYALIIYDNDDPERPLITWRFYIFENIAQINTRIKRASFDPVNGENQEIDFTINHGKFNIQNPNSDVKVVITQNNRTDNAITDLKPLFIHNGKLEYEYNSGNIFKGENEFRAFEIRNIKHPGNNVKDISFFSPVYHATLQTDYPRLLKPYSYFKEMNGSFVVEAIDRDYPETEADYMFVHFTLEVKKPLLGGGIYVFGEFSNWQCRKSYEMKYNMERQNYELMLLLKQGYYNYTYAYRDEKSGTIKCYNLEGSHFETENDYQIYVYYGERTDRYDRLIGYNEFNSLTGEN